MNKGMTLLLAMTLLGLAGCGAGNAEALKATGTVESTQVTISPETGGRIIEVTAQEGDHVKAGQVLVRLDDTLLQSQLRQAQSSLKAAQANYDLLAAGPTSEQVRQSEAALSIATAAYSRTVTSSRQSDIDAAQSALNAASEAYNKVKAGPQQEDYAAAEAAYRNAEAALKQAQFAYDASFKRDPAGINASPAAMALEQATNNYNAAKSAYDKVAKSPDNAQISAAFQQVQTARAALDKATTPARDFDIQQAQAQVDQAQAALDALKAGARQQQLDAAKAQAEAAQAAVDTLQVQIKKLTLLAPMDGVLLSRSVEPGEVASAGTPLLTLSQLDDLKLTVYVPEDRYGQIKLGQAAQVTVDTFPNVPFTATVRYIADAAEFTPRNVQTSDGRRTTVFAVRLGIADTSNRLKPGMPADVVFGN